MVGQSVSRHQAADGRRIYRIEVQLFPKLRGNVYVVTGGRETILVDCGSGLDRSNADLERGLASIGERFGESIGFDDLGAILITHGHIDHFGGLAHVRSRSAAPVYVHLLDRRILSHYEERVAVASRGLRQFLRVAGVGDLRRERYLAMYLDMKRFFRSIEVEHDFEEGDLLDGEIRTIHVPGHCPGQVCLGVDDILLTADHVLERISPHLWPETITLTTGLGHYLDSLRKIEQVSGYRLGLGGHGGPIEDLPVRIEEIRGLHEKRLGQVLELCAKPRSILAISRELFGPVPSYHSLLALLETGALVEYLYQRGELVASNVAEIENDPDPVFHFRRE